MSAPALDPGLRDVGGYDHRRVEVGRHAEKRAHEGPQAAPDLIAAKEIDQDIEHDKASLKVEGGFCTWWKNFVSFGFVSPYSSPSSAHRNREWRTCALKALGAHSPRAAQTPPSGRP
jgi:hypothetical protein